ncbi:MAG: hypothetical protein ACKOB9_00320 [Solirubrobacterales bacterium]
MSTAPASGPTAAGGSLGRKVSAEAITGAILLVAGLVVCSVTALRGIQPNDEGLMLQAAARIASGEVPYRDFWWYYPPGQPYLLAGLWKLSGPSLLDWRILRVIANAVVALLAWRLALRRSTPPFALLAWAVALLAMAYPSGPHPFPVALALALGALLLFERHPIWAGVLVGACAAWRLEFAGYLGLGILLALAISPETASRQRGIPRVLGASVLTGLILYLPVVVPAGIDNSWELLVRYPLTEFGDYQGLPFPLAYDGPLNTSSLGGFLSDSAENLLAWWLPLVAVVGFAGAAAALLATFRRATDWPVIATLVFTVGMAHYLLVRPDIFHTAPLVVTGAVLSAWALASWSRGTIEPVARKVIVGAGAVLAGASLAYAAVEGLDRQWLLLRAPAAKVEAPPADGVRAEPALARSLSAAVAEARRLSSPGEPIYVMGRRADITTAGAPLFYVLAERPNPTRYDIAAPGVVTSAPVQEEIVEDLRSASPPVIVRWDSPQTAAPEPNRAGRSSGVRILDRYVDSAYREAGRFGDWIVLTPR